MPWTTAGDRTIYHGTLYPHAITIVGGTNIFSKQTAPAQGINLALCSHFTDFGRGFYTTTNLHQAKQWANDRCQPWKRPNRNKIAAVLAFDVSWDALADLSTLAFVWEGAPRTSGYWTLVGHCRAGRPNRQTTVANPSGGPFDVVYGPVSLWSQYLVLAQCDQISFHTDPALSALRNGRILAHGTLANPFLS